jgi:hypothetical protein
MTPQRQQESKQMQLQGCWQQKGSQQRQERQIKGTVSREIATGVVDISGKFAAGIVDLPPVSTTLAKLVANFAAGVIDTGGSP